MKQFVQFGQCIGKTMEGEGYDLGRAVQLITFTDGTWTALRGRKDWDGDVEIEEATYTLDCPEVYFISRSELVRLGILTEEELTQKEASLRLEYASRQEREERAALARLKAKYEGK